MLKQRIGILKPQHKQSQVFDFVYCEVLNVIIKQLFSLLTSSAI